MQLELKVEKKPEEKEISPLGKLSSLAHHNKITHAKRSPGSVPNLGLTLREMEKHDLSYKSYIHKDTEAGHNSRFS